MKKYIQYAKKKYDAPTLSEEATNHICDVSDAPPNPALAPLGVNRDYSTWDHSGSLGMARDGLGWLETAQDGSG